MAAVDPPPPVIAPNNQIVIRSVWSNNLDDEFDTIRELMNQFRFISIDTEFPGVIFPQPLPLHQNENPTTNYRALKYNVDTLKLIQVGITLTDSEGNLPDLGTPNRRYIWQFNFRDFDLANDRHAPHWIQMHLDNGIDFEIMHERGISSVDFAEKMRSSGLVRSDNVTYVTFHGGYDFGYLLKALTGGNLPDTLPEFDNLLRTFFGNTIYDVKHIAKSLGFFGGLNGAAELFGVLRPVGRSHQAGSDSLLTWLVFERIRDVHLGNGGLDRFGCVLNGLELPQ